MKFGTFFAIGLSLLLTSKTAIAGPQRTLVIDDFEHGVADWTRNDKIKSDSPGSGVVLVDLISTRPSPGGLPGSAGAGLFTFKDAKSSWASVSHHVDGAAWVALGAQRLTFWLNADGAKLGTTLVLRSRYQTSTGTKEESFDIPVRLNVRSWRRVAVPLTDIRNANGPLLAHLKNIYLIQFVQRGNWDSRFFAVDQLQVEGSSPDEAETVPTEDEPIAAPPAATTRTADGQTVHVAVDYLKKQGRIRTSANIAVGAGVPSSSGIVSYPLNESDAFAHAIKTLHPRFVRLDVGALADMIDSLRPTFDYARLSAAARQARAVGAEPLLALSCEPAWGLDARAYAAYCVGAARAADVAGVRPVRYFELPTAATTQDDNAAIVLYNAGRAALKALSPLNRVGGIGASSGRTGTLVALLSRAAGLDFLSLQYYGVMAGMPTNDILFRSAVELTTLRMAAAALDKSRWNRAPIYLTAANLNAARGETQALPLDGRVVQMTAAAWWASFLGNSSRLADQVFHNDAVNPEWGLLDENARAYPAYYSLWMWNTFFPSGSERAQAISDSTRAVAFAANTPTAHNLMVANTTDNETAVRIAIRGFPVLRAARMRILEEPQRGVRFEELPKSPFQTLVLKPHAVAVIQFIEPPKK